MGNGTHASTLIADSQPCSYMYVPCAAATQNLVVELMDITGGNRLSDRLSACTTYPATWLKDACCDMVKPVTRPCVADGTGEFGWIWRETCRSLKVGPVCEN